MHRMSLLLVFAACTVDSGDESFIIRNNLAPPSDGCAFTADLAAPILPRGQIRTDSPIPYLLDPLFESRIVAPEGKESQRTIFVKGAKVELVIGPIESIDASGTVSLDTTTETVKFESLFSTPIPPNGGLSAGQFDLVSLDALARINAKTNPANRIHAQIVATSTVFGDYYGDQIESAPYQYPVTACNDCVFLSAGTCPLPMGTLLRGGNVCNPFQDGVVDCCTDPTSGNLICPATVATM